MPQCENFFKNGTPRDWNADIVECGAKWWYKDQGDRPTGGSDQDSIRRRLRSGDSTSLWSPSSACTYQTLSLVKVEVGGDSRIFSDRGNAGANKCIIRFPVLLAPKLVDDFFDQSSAADSVEDVLKRIDLTTAKVMGLFSDLRSE